MLGVEDKVPVPVIKLNVGKVRIDSDSESKYDEEEAEFAIPNSEQVVFPEETNYSTWKDTRLLWNQQLWMKSL